MENRVKIWKIQFKQLQNSCVLIRDAYLEDLVKEDAINYRNKLRQILTNLSKYKDPTPEKILIKNLFTNYLVHLQESYSEVIDSFNNKLFQKLMQLTKFKEIYIYILYIYNNNNNKQNEISFQNPLFSQSDLNTRNINKNKQILNGNNGLINHLRKYIIIRGIAHEIEKPYKLPDTFEQVITFDWEEKGTDMKITRPK